MNQHSTSRFYSQGHLQPHEAQLVEVEEARRLAGARAAMGEWISARLEGEVEEELGPRGERRGGASGKWECLRCGTALRVMFRRNGHYRRELVTMVGPVRVRVPLIKCKCGKHVHTPWKTLVSRSRYWYDIASQWERQYMAGSSYRKTAELLSSQAGTQTSHMAGWRETQKAGAAARRVRQALDCPKVVILDEMYVWEKGSKKAVLLAIDLRGTILDFEGPTSRSAENWRQLLERLSERGVDPDHGLEYVVADGDNAIRQAVEWVWGAAKVQHCVWHILMAIRGEAQRVYGEASRMVTQIVEEARAVLMHKGRSSETRQRAGERMAAFLKKHTGMPWAEIMARCYTQATTYLLNAEVPRTNGTAERTIKELRRRIKTMDGFKSHMGAKNLLAVLIQWLNWWRELPTTSKRNVSPSLP